MRRKRDPFGCATKLATRTLIALLVGLLIAAAASGDVPLPLPPIGPEVTPDIASEPSAPSAGCGFSDEPACRAAANCFWQEIYGTVPGGPAAAFCRPRMHASQPPRN